MKRKDTAKKMEAKSCLSISDWVAFLSSERQAMMSNAVTFSVFLVAVIALILVTSGHIVFAIASGIIAFGCAGWVYFGVLEPLRQRGKLADEILKGIISGELKDADSIREGWLLGLTVIRRGWFRQERARLTVLKRAWRRQWKPRLATLKETWRPRWERGTSALKETWCQGKARLVAFRETWRRQWVGGISYSQASVAPVGSGTSYAHGNSGSRNKSKQVRAPSRRSKNA